MQELPMAQPDSPYPPEPFRNQSMQELPTAQPVSQYPPANHHHWPQFTPSTPVVQPVSPYPPANHHHHPKDPAPVATTAQQPANQHHQSPLPGLITSAAIAAVAGSAKSAIGKAECFKLR